MHFKSLELVGFKSFAEKTKLNFEPGVTAVVGPNGCGKSNIADSIRWVLGEQSAKSLRAGNMQDVIFNGTDNKEPINLAEVSLTFSNENRSLPIDYDEVTITRRIFRSGETEYLLNKTPVRLKDISELLMGTGIGTESYSIIEQGKMDLILSSKPEDRRYVFKEASGITKYKSKKKEALGKLEQTEQNILRINDIIQEVKRQISSIERQARKAEKYKVDFDRLKELEIKLSSCDYKNLKTQEATHSVESSDAKSRERDLSEEISSVAAKIASYRQSLDEMSLKISELKNKNAEMVNAVDMNDHKIEIDKERIEETRVIQEGLKKEIESASGKIENARAALDKAKADLDTVGSSKIEKQKSLEEKEFSLGNIAKEIEETEVAVKTCKVEIVDYLSKETRIKNDLIKMGADIQNRSARQRRLNIEKDTVGKELTSAETMLSEVGGEFADKEKKVSELRGSLDSRTGLHLQALEQIKKLGEDISVQENKISAARSKIEVLEDNVKSYEGFSRGVRSLLTKAGEAGGSVVGVIGVLAEILNVEKGYEEAVDTFLGSDAQVIVTEKDSDIKNSIEYLAANNMGKASFVSLETLRKIERKPMAERGDGLIPLKRFVNIASGHDIILNYFFHNAYVARSIEDGMKDFSFREEAVLVTKDGTMFNGGRVSGGSASGSGESMLIGRKDRLEDLRVQLNGLEKTLEELSCAKKEKIEADKATESDIASLGDNLHKEEINLANIKSKKDGHEEAAKKLRDEIEVLTLELDEITETISEMTKKGESLNSELNKIEIEKSDKQSFIDNSQEIVLQKKNARETLAADIAALRAEAQSLEKEEEALKNNLKNQESFLYELEDTLYSKQNLLKESIDKIKLLEIEVTQLKDENGKITGNLSILSEEIAGIEKKRSEETDKLSIDELQLKDRDGALEGLRNQIRDLDVKLTEINYKKTNLKERILQTYKVDLEATHIEVEDGIDWDAVKGSVAELKDKLDKMGPVNLVAIDEHKELEERHAFLVHQQEDLVNAKDSLHKAIQKINKTTKELFLDAFQKIQVEFKNFFRLLFGGGQAELVLIDEQDILESGIEIIVRPPGKKLQNLMLLSGGEKALTAIALLFAIFKVKPSPFCVLDEIDAPLDESNVNRFSNVLKDFLRISQFIIITHNKRTMELADIMYGITMQERGVSKIVSVKFLDDRKKVQSEPSGAGVAAS